MIQQTQLRILLICAALAPAVRGANLTYKVTLNAEVCQQVRIGTLTSHVDFGRGQEVDSGHFNYALRAGDERSLYVTAEYVNARRRGDPDLLSPEKYAIDLSRPVRVRRISEAEWDSAARLSRSGGGVWGGAGQILLLKASFTTAAFLSVPGRDGPGLELTRLSIS